MYIYIYVYIQIYLLAIYNKTKEGLEDALNPGFAVPVPVPDADTTCPAHVRSSTLPNATLNLVLAVLGAGQLTLPYAMGQRPGER